MPCFFRFSKSPNEILKLSFIPIFCKTILSFLWTIANAGHKWELVDELKRTFPNCIFQKPQWDLPYESDSNYCDDREITSFCDIINTKHSLYAIIP